MIGISSRYARCPIAGERPETEIVQGASFRTAEKLILAEVMHLNSLAGKVNVGGFRDIDSEPLRWTLRDSRALSFRASSPATGPCSRNSYFGNQHH